MILAGDIGGTKVRLALCAMKAGDVRLLHEQTVASRSVASFEDALESFLSAHARPLVLAACFGVPGAVIDGRCRPTNLPWTLDEALLARRLGVTRLRLLNDAEAAAYGMLHLRADDLVALNPHASTRRDGNVVLVSVGTGLGEALLYWDGSAYHSIASEGGHSDFAPRTDQELALFRYLRARFAHVSYERVLSGPGLFNIYSFLRDTGFSAEPAWLAERLAREDPNAVVGEAGVAGLDPSCAEAVALFAAILGAEAGNLVLTVLARGGVFLTGGVAAALVPALQGSRFIESFTDKGRFADLLRSTPVHVSRNLDAALLGAAHFAAELARR